MGKTQIIGKSTAVQSMLGFIAKAAESSLPVLIEGESGVGKELVATSIHEQSKRYDRPFIAVNCGAMPKDLLENEIFGHEAGAFTGATSLKRGLFDIADGGTLFIDEIGEMDPTSQVKLLRVLETGKFRRLGSTREQTVDVRILSATNKILEKQIAHGAFRADLYYRLSVLRSFVPPLRDRKDDIKSIAEYIVEKKINPLKGENEKLAIEKCALDILEKYSWPGNVRELQNVLNRSALMCKGNKILADDLPESVRKFSDEKNPEPLGKVPGEVSLEEYSDAREREYISLLMNKYANDKERVAGILEISRAQFYRKLKKHGFIRKIS